MSDSRNYDEPIERTLTVVNFGLDDDTGKLLKTRVTLSPGMIQVIIASEESVQKIGGTEQHKVNVLFVDSNQMELFLTILDLTTLERAVGAFFLP
jgi:hypothetical protein